MHQSLSTIQFLLAVSFVITICRGDQCKDLLMGQYYCDDPVIDIETQAEVNCREDTHTTEVSCKPAEEIICVDFTGSNRTFNGSEVGFYKNVSCRWTNGYHFETSLLLSIFLGMFGVDRFYLGYPAVGLLKFSTLGFFFLGQLVDILLIAMQVVKPSDGSEYVIDYYGAGVTKVSMNTDTYIKPPDSW
ncbi:hypothetical protein FSP39_019088 [Pinctada imbricata]|uniref:TM2 domain-containing protein n=1 Tax=Pinctada imbricata TaxID=66713 RepID=A0AA88XN80_PINIB|nr:hypothetical protein FSP39_019088 [Pinctada imbricata]